MIHWSNDPAFYKDYWKFLAVPLCISTFCPSEHMHYFHEMTKLLFFNAYLTVFDTWNASPNSPWFPSCGLSSRLEVLFEEVINRLALADAGIWETPTPGLWVFAMAAHQHSTCGKVDGAITMSLAAKKIRFICLSGSGKAGFATQAREKVKNNTSL